ncbi:MAG: UDP-N-acetylglucosamine diphosphorylase/glucosamine-1-phosphate N-acetyltransferase [Dehalococcoidia bacterium]|nr:UDP-N-acetylglucosamine diphosphorylase/glucosamine-1-phosphate N-acetyltransferase [Dehalococcoidia bacterium]
MTADWAGVVLAAGKGTRMRSRIPKVLHRVAGWPMVRYGVSALAALSPGRLVVVTATGQPEVEREVSNNASVVTQHPALGTGHALAQTRPELIGRFHLLLVVNGDAPLVRTETLQTLLESHRASGAALSIVTCRRADPAGLGRVVRNGQGGICGIVEERDASPEQRLLRETNEGAYCLDASWVWDALDGLPRHDNGECYITDLVARAVAGGLVVNAHTIDDEYEMQGVNDRVQLAVAEGIMRRRIRERLMRAGVTMVYPDSTFVDAGVEIGEDTVLHPNTTISGASVIGRDCEIGPSTVLSDARVGNGCRIVASMVESSVIEAGVTIGPFSHIRPGSHIEEGVHLGNYVEVKKSRIGRHSQAGHFSYLGDATIGERVNIGAGTVTCNYDGEAKHETHIGDGVFIGSDTMLVAPVRLGDGAATGAGAVVTHDVASGALVVGVPAKPVQRRKRRLEGGD